MKNKDPLVNYECDGQMDIYEYLETLKPVPVDIYGICDDAYCPKCGYAFMDPMENDMPKCPVCGIRVDWEPWHRLNDNE